MRLPILVVFSSWIFVSHDQCLSADFVERTGRLLTLDGAPFCFLGANAYFLLVDAARGDTQAVHEVFSSARDMGMTVVRTWAFHDSPDSLDLTVIQYLPGAFNETALRGLDYVIDVAGQYNIRLILPLVNNWDDYGGMNQYVEWRSSLDGRSIEKPLPGYSAAQQMELVTGSMNRSYRLAINSLWGHDDFYQDSVIRSWYQAYIERIALRVNSRSSIAYKDDPTILAWELANEPRSSDASGLIVNSWVSDMATFLKSVDQNHLIGTGEEGFDVISSSYSVDLYNKQFWLFDGSEGVSFTLNTQIPFIDYGSIHMYPDSWNLTAGDGNTWIRDHLGIASALDKPLLVGEFGIQSDKELVYLSWTNTANVEGASGALVWQLLSRNRNDPQGFGIQCPNDGAVCVNLSRCGSDSGGLPSPFVLYQNFPNPFNSTTIIQYSLLEDSFVELGVWDAIGQKVAVLYQGPQTGGVHLDLFDSFGLATGIYFYRLTGGSFTDVKKLVVVK